MKCPNCGHLVLLREEVRTLQEVTDERIRAALARFGLKGVRAAAHSLNVHPSTVYRWLRKHPLNGDTNGT